MSRTRILTHWNHCVFKINQKLSIVPLLSVGACPQQNLPCQVL